MKDIKIWQITSIIGHRLTGAANGRKAEQYVYDLIKSYAVQIEFQSFDARGWNRGVLHVEVKDGIAEGILDNVVPGKAVEQELFDIKGVVKDAVNGTPVEGVTILAVLKGTQVSFRGIGYTTHNQTINRENNNLTISLQPNETALSEVIVTALEINTDPNKSLEAYPDQFMAPALVNSVSYNMNRNRGFNNELMQVTVNVGDSEGKAFLHIVPDPDATLAGDKIINDGFGDMNLKNSSEYIFSTVRPPGNGDFMVFIFSEQAADGDTKPSEGD
ncbi:hypothetical protein FQR65_LT17639 [Abscondita terminalis]|nr:hypothetical protein FQR65_LT17639 [Abscondita terminalis]